VLPYGVIKNVVVVVVIGVCGHCRLSRRVLQAKMVEFEKAIK